MTKCSPRPFADYESELLMRKVEASSLPVNIGTLLRERASQFPERPVLNFFDDSEVLSFRDLDERVTRLASGFHRLGIGKGSHVGVMVFTCATYPVTWLALARLGAVTVPINFNYTSRELEYMLTDSRVGVSGNRE